MKDGDRIIKQAHAIQIIENKPVKMVNSTSMKVKSILFFGC